MSACRSGMRPCIAVLVLPSVCSGAHSGFLRIDHASIVQAIAAMSRCRNDFDDALSYLLDQNGNAQLTKNPRSAQDEAARKEAERERERAEKEKERAAKAAAAGAAQHPLLGLKAEGVVKSIVEDKGFGFIQWPDGPDIFYHFTEVKSAGGGKELELGECLSAAAAVELCTLPGLVWAQLRSVDF